MTEKKKENQFSLDRKNEVERIAHRVYLNRKDLDKNGDEQADWETAEKIATQPLRKLLFFSSQPLIKLKKAIWDVSQCFIFALPQYEWTKLVAAPLILAIAGSIISSQIQQESNQISALNKYLDQLEKLTFEQKLLSDSPNDGAIVIARGRTVAALQEFDIKRKRQLIAFLKASGMLEAHDISSSPVISFEGANLIGIDFQNTNLSGLYLQQAELMKANLVGADLREVNLTQADLSQANLKEIDLRAAQLHKTRFVKANLQDADLREAFIYQTNFNGAKLLGAFLTNTHLKQVDLRKADLTGADLSGADIVDVHFGGATLSGANLENTRFQDVVELTEKQLAQALLCHTILPEGIELDPNRDCGKISSSP